MVFVMGDTHFPIDGNKLFKEQSGFPFSTLQRSDYVIVLGDFGLFWKKQDKHNAKNMRQIHALPYTLLFVDGNHENFDWLEEFPVEYCFGGQVQRCGENILHLMRGEIYTIEDKRFFVCGGATSTDKEYRQKHVSWWPVENLSGAEERKAIENLNHAAGPIDFILTHTCPESIVEQMFKVPVIYSDVTAKFLDNIKDRLPSTPWYFGHWHEDKDWGRFRCLYNKVVLLEDRENTDSA